MIKEIIWKIKKELNKIIEDYNDNQTLAKTKEKEKQKKDTNEQTR